MKSWPIRSFKGNVFRVQRDERGRITKYVTRSSSSKPVRLSKADLGSLAREYSGKVYRMPNGFVVREKGRILKYLHGVTERNVKSSAKIMSVAFKDPRARKDEDKRQTMRIRVYNAQQAAEVGRMARQGKVPFVKGKPRRRIVDLLLDEIEWQSRTVKGVGS